MLAFDVLLERDALVVERRARQRAHEARVLQDLLLLLFLASQVRERVDDHTENEVQRDNDDNEEEQQVVDHTQVEQWILLHGKNILV